MNNQLTYIVTGGLLFILLHVIYKPLRKPKIYWTIFALTCGFALFGYLNIDRPSLQMARGNAVTYTFLPILYIVYFGPLRQWFLKVFKNEPLMAGYMQWSWDQGEYRRLHFGDVIFTIATLILPILTIILVD